MPKRRIITSSSINKIQKQGRGKGNLKTYQPWITVRDVSSKGFSHRIKGWKTKRVHHLLSNLELSFFYTVEWASNVIDIREKYPLLPLDRTLEICSRFNIQHPIDKSKNEAIVMTTDFLINIHSNDDEPSKLVAYSVIPSNKRNNKRVLQRTYIERTYWKEQGIDFFVVTENDINKNLVKNIEWLYDAKELTFAPGISKKDLYNIEPALFESITKEELSFANACERTDKYFGLDPGVCIWIVRHLIANRLWIVDMTQIIITTKHVNIERSQELLKMLNKEFDVYDIGS